MKKRLAKWLLRVIKKLDKDICIENAKVVEGYDAKKIGLTIKISEKSLKDFRSKGGTTMTLLEGERCIIHEAKKDIRNQIMGCIVSNGLIEYQVKRDNGGLCVSGEMKVYVRSAKDNDYGKSHKRI